MKFYSIRFYKVENSEALLDALNKPSVPWTSIFTAPITILFDANPFA